MCCFSQRVEHVSNTSIFARGVNGRQFLAYEMTYAAQSDLAMVLPLPVPPGSPEDAVRFINLESYPAFFEDLRYAFIYSPSAKGGRTRPVPASVLVVHSVGRFEASFVPTVADFRRLDRRFRIPPAIWDQLPKYCDYGFAVFKLKATAPQGFREYVRRWWRGPEPASLSKVHPMALDFPRRNPDLLYFPTIHIHHLEVEPSADFEHEIFWQYSSPPDGWPSSAERSGVPLGSVMDVDRAQGLIHPNAKAWKLRLNGRLKNVDSWVGPGGSLPELLEAR